MDLTLLKKLVRIVEHSKVDEIEVEEEGLRIRVARNSHNNARSTLDVSSPEGTPVVAPALPSPPELPSQPALPEVQYNEIKSPIVGTFYRAPAPDADAYVEVGQLVQAKTVLCIIEAMKLMNEIESDVAGRIVKILVENGQPVEYNQPLFLLEPV